MYCALNTGLVGDFNFVSAQYYTTPMTTIFVIFLLLIIVLSMLSGVRRFDDKLSLLATIDVQAAKLKGQESVVSTLFYLDSGNTNGGNAGHNVQYSSILMSGAEKMFLSESHKHRHRKQPCVHVDSDTAVARRNPTPTHASVITPMACGFMFGF